MRVPVRAGDGRGVLSLEFALVVVGVLGALMLLAAAWRLGQTRGEIRDVAAEAARAASLRQHPHAAADAAERIARASLGRRSVRCSEFVPSMCRLWVPEVRWRSVSAVSRGSKTSRSCACPGR